MTEAELIAPIGYDSGWLVLGIAILAVVVVGAAALVFARRGSPKGTRAAGEVGDRGLRGRYHAQIDAVEEDVAAGSISAREAHLRLSALVRSFARDTTGVNAPVMTLTELRQSPLPEVTAAVAEYYPSSFEPGLPGDIESALSRARRVIDS